MKPIELDGRTGEGGGQLVRVAIAVAALTTQPVKITNVRGNREHGRGGGLKSQHVAAVQWLADATDADVEGLSVGSKALTFVPKRRPSELPLQDVKISASGAASTLLIIQAILPFLIFSGNGDAKPVSLDLSGGTNVSFSLSFEYLDQVLLPTLEQRFGIKTERALKKRGWSLGAQSCGAIFLKVYPLGPGQKLNFNPPAPLFYPDSYQVNSVDVNIITPAHSHEDLQGSLAKDLNALFPDADVHFKHTEDSGGDARWYILLVALSAAGIRWGKDILCSMPKKTKSRDAFVSNLSRKLCRELYDEVATAGQVDEHLQDQVICFQALCEGLSSLPRGDHPSEPTSKATLDEAMENLSISGSRIRKEKSHEPFGHGSLHAQTARWVVSELLPRVEFYNKGDIMRGVGTSFAA